ncbi:MarR family winged helix-turn-helix transcriptional regulator [Wohlfahrtiimonas populi]|uniref:MarR family winged helix-turn-helix transcriptional regulator n=1 Tax=Wohlfahrtiimonas populi TaxID=1940240 RepID=UPI00098D0179|nr:MarR family transcriptional regulator [Wohlfahrtiimonas populi]
MSQLPNFRIALIRSARLFSDEINTLLEPYQLNFSLWQALYAIHQKKECTSIEIAEELNVSKPSITKRMQALEKLQLIQPLPSIDKRQKLFCLSNEGHKLYQICANQIDALEENLLSAFAESDTEQTQHLLTQLIATLQQRKMEQK